MRQQTSFSVANFNVHAGIDGWGRRFDAVGACRALDTDIIVIEEDWIADDPVDSIGARVAELGGYEIISASSGRARRMLAPRSPEQLPTRWAPRRSPRLPPPIRLEGTARALRARSTSAERTMPASTGVWATTLLSRIPIRHHEFLPLPVLRADIATRSAIIARLELAGSEAVSVIAVHLGHLTHGSPRQMRVLRRRALQEPGIVIVVGDLNCWGPPLRVFLRGLYDIVSGPTWPAWRPHSRIDHILTNGPSRVIDSRVLDDAGSDHLPIRATFEVTTR